MSLEQSLAFAVLIGTVALFVWGRLRYDMVAMLGLLVGIAVGVVPMDEAFSGFSDEIVIIIASALVVSAAVERTGFVEALVRPLERYMRSTGAQIAVLGGAVTALSAFVKNIGALAIFIPIAMQFSRRNKTPVSRLLMPLSFGSLLGGLMTLIGTSPNIIVARMREEILGEPFGMFDFMPVGFGLALAGVAFLTFGWRLLPKERRGKLQEAFKLEDFTTEAVLPATSPMVGKTVADLERLSEDAVTVIAIIREKWRRYVPANHWVLFADDVLVLEGDANEFKKLMDKAKLQLVGHKDLREEQLQADEIGVIEAVVLERSRLVGSSAELLQLRQRYRVNLLAIRRAERRIAQRLRRVRFQPGDVIVLQGALDTMPATLADLGCLPLAQRNIRLGERRRAALSLPILAIAMILVAFQLVPVSVAFFGAATLIVLTGALTLRETYETIPWPIIVLIGALLPLSEAVQRTGGSDIIAGFLASLAVDLPPIGALAITLILAMAVTPFLNNAATVLVMAPVAAGVARNLGLNPDPFLMVVAIGAACDFLTPIGHQCNTLVMGPGGYRFGDYWRLGLPLSLVVAVVGSGLVAFFWPLG
ncbi:MAG TPA: SLC13 family permease [Alphaproteobacteria bacterium]|nr:SLC13 family permease [Alphaproteobacteria bacterium]